MLRMFAFCAAVLVTTGYAAFSIEAFAQTAQSQPSAPPSAPPRKKSIFDTLGESIKAGVAQRVQNGTTESPATQPERKRR